MGLTNEKAPPGGPTGLGNYQPTKLNIESGLNKWGTQYIILLAPVPRAKG